MNLDRIFKIISKPLTLIIFLFLFGFLINLCFYNLGKFPLENWDEAWYGQVTKEIIQRQNPIVLYWNYEIWLDKPPMFMWIAALISSINGLNEFSIRLPSAISAFIIVSASTIYVYRKYSMIPALFTFFTLTLNNLFVYRARSGNLDLLATLFVFLSYLLMLSKTKYKYPLLGVVFGCLYLTKASLVLFPFAIFVLSEVIYERKNIRKNLIEYAKLIAIFLGISGAWLYLGYLQAGSDFINYYLFKSDQGVARIMHFNSAYIGYTYYMLQRRFFWLFLVGIGFALLKIKQKEYFLLIAFSTFLLTQLSFTERANNWYLTPSMPFWSITVGFAVYSILNVLRNKKALYIGTAVILLAVSGYIWQKTYRVNILPIFDSAAVIPQMESARKIKSLSKPDEIIIRLDTLAPTTLYYSDRKTLSHVSDSETAGYWVSKEDIFKSINDNKVRFLVGTKPEVDQFLFSTNSAQFKKIESSGDEVILIAQ